MSTDPLSPLAHARTFLLVPADRPERYGRALAAGAGAVVIDLEDAVAPDNKDSARQALADGFAAISLQDRGRVLVRVNAFATRWHEADGSLVTLLSQQGLGGVMFPKAERVADLLLMAKAIGKHGVLIPLLESLEGLDTVNAIACAPQVLRLAFGHLDFQVDLGLACDATEAELTSVRMALVMASRRANLAQPIDGVTTEWKDGARVASDTHRARRAGFGAKLCIHPSQVALVQQALKPTQDELTWATRVVEAARTATGAVVSLDGRMVDAPVVLQAQRLIASASE